MASGATSDRELVLERVFAAPRELVWTVWTDARHVGQWFGPRGFRITTHEMDVRPGGVWRFTMHAPDGIDYPNLATFVDVVEPERLVYLHGSEADDENTFEVTITLIEDAGRTRLRLRQLYATVEARAYAAREIHAIEMGNQTLDKLAEYLAAM